MKGTIFVLPILSLALLAFDSSLCPGAQQLVAQAADRPHYSDVSGETKQPTIDDATLRKAAVVFPSVRQINLETSQALSRTNSQKEQQQILAQAQSKQVAMVRSAGISVDQYNQVIQSVRNNPDLETKFASYVKAANGGTK